ncbi:MAG: LysM peptidoglycan-binding domain-containing protein [Opitutales bacterium]|nr:LysM peptidoglycan-binding domain-containing protein [Opitutales bacterium]
MEDDNQISTVSKPVVPIAIAIVGVILGIIALFVAISSANRAGLAEANLSKMQDSLNKAEALQIELKDTAAKIETLASQLEDLKVASVANVNALANKTQNLLTALNGEIAKNRELIANMQSVSKAKASKPAAAKPEAQANAEASPASAPSQSASAEGTIYRVRPNDTLVKIAKKHGKKLSEIQNANPNVDSKRLLVGQKIVIPQ